MLPHFYLFIYLLLFFFFLDKAHSFLQWLYRRKKLNKKQVFYTKFRLKKNTNSFPSFRVTNQPNIFPACQNTMERCPEEKWITTQLRKYYKAV